MSFNITYNTLNINFTLILTVLQYHIYFCAIFKLII